MDIYNYLKHKFEQFREFAIFLFMHTEATRMYIKVSLCSVHWVLYINELIMFAVKHQLWSSQSYSANYGMSELYNDNKIVLSKPLRVLIMTLIPSNFLKCN